MHLTQETPDWIVSITDQTGMSAVNMSRLYHIHHTQTAFLCSFDTLGLGQAVCTLLIKLEGKLLLECHHDLDLHHPYSRLSSSAERRVQLLCMEELAAVNLAGQNVDKILFV